MDKINFTPSAQECLAAAQRRALAQEHARVLPAHLVLALLDNKQGAAVKLIKSCGDLVQPVSQAAERLLDEQPRSANAPLALDASLARVLAKAESIARTMGDSSIASDTLLLALAQQGFPPLESAKLEAALRRKERCLEDSEGEGEGDLQKYTHDLTEQAKEGRLDPVIGRDEEIRRVIQILSRRLKNNPVLIGAPGVGKTAIVEGLAQRIVEGDVPETLRGKRVLALDAAAMLAGTQFRGAFETRVKAVLAAIERSEGEILCFIDEMHVLVGAGRSEGAMDAANMLKPALARGTLRCLAATTLDEYRKYVEKDSALARRFQPIMVEQPSEKDSIAIMRGISEKYALHHGVRIKDSALVAAVNLSARYINDRFLPDKALDLIDEAAAGLRIEIESRPESLDRLQRRQAHLRIEQAALKREENAGSEARLAEIKEEQKTLDVDLSEQEDKWRHAREKIEQSQSLKEELERTTKALAECERNGDYERAGVLKYQTLPELEARLEAASAQPDCITRDVEPEDVARVVARWTGIPAEKLLDEEKQRLLRMEQELGKRVVGQGHALEAVSRAIRRARTGVADSNRPYGAFLLLGPTGVGKTELARALAEFLFDDARALVAISMSEYMEKHSVSRLLGAPPGYVGFEEGGLLTEAVRAKPYSVLLFDEAEKAHAEVFNVLLQMLDEGRLTDAQGHVVDFRNTIVLLTSNIIPEGSSKGEVLRACRGYFRQEFLNRLDDILLFNSLTQQDMGEIVKLQMARLVQRIGAMNVVLEVDEGVVSWLARVGYDAQFGARALQRTMRCELEDLVAKVLLETDKKDELPLQLWARVAEDERSLVVETRHKRRLLVCNEV